MYVKDCGSIFSIMGKEQSQRAAWEVPTVAPYLLEEVRNGVTVDFPEGGMMGHITSSLLGRWRRREEERVEGSQWLSHFLQNYGAREATFVLSCAPAPTLHRKADKASPEEPEQSCGLFSTGDLGSLVLAL